MWDFWSLSPESLHQVTILFSDRGLPQTVRHMNGYGSHTFSMINAEQRACLGEVPLQVPAGSQALDQRRSPRSGRPDARIHPGGPVRRHRARRLPPLDALTSRSCRRRTPHGRRTIHSTSPRCGRTRTIPLIEVGVMELNRNPGQLLRRNRATGLLAVEHRARHRLFTRQDAPGAHLRLRRRSSLPHRHPLRGAAGQCAKMSGAHLRQGRPDALHGQSAAAIRDAFYEPNSFGGAVQAPAIPRAAASDRGRRRSIRPPARATTTTNSQAICSGSWSVEGRERLMDNIAEAMQGVPLKL